MAESHPANGATSVQRAEAFRFEHTVEVSEATYTELHQLRPPSPRQRVLVLSLAAAGLTLLMGGWTRSLGTLMLVSAAILWSLPHLARRGVVDEYARAGYRRAPTTFGVSNRSIWLRGGPLRAESDWTGLDHWDRHGDWIVLRATGMPQVILPAGELERAGVLEWVMAMARAHGRGPEETRGQGERSPG